MKNTVRLPKKKKVVLIIDANIGPTEDDLEILHNLEDYKKDIIVVANKIDKIKKAGYEEQLKTIKNLV